MIKEIDYPTEIKEGNDLIDRFMEREPSNWSPSHQRKGYDNDWNYLMAVVEKIEKDISRGLWYGFTVEIRDHYCCVACHEKGKQSGVVCSTPYLTKPESKILAVWNMIVEFIKWYNSYPA